MGQSFNSAVYPTTSNAGNLCLLLGVSWMIHKVQKDLILAGTFADFLHTSNLVLKRSLQKDTNAVPQHTISKEIMQHFSQHRLMRVGTQQFVNGIALVAPSKRRHEHDHNHDTLGDIELTASTPVKSDRHDDDIVTISTQYELVIDSTNNGHRPLSNTPSASVTFADSVQYGSV